MASDGTIKPSDTEDPWGNDFLYYSPGVRSGKEYEIISRGPNEGDEDDIVSFTKRGQQG